MDCGDSSPLLLSRLVDALTSELLAKSAFRKKDSGRRGKELPGFERRRVAAAHNWAQRTPTADFTFANACARSSIKSSGSSIPTLKRRPVAVMPLA